MRRIRWSNIYHHLDTRAKIKTKESIHKATEDVMYVKKKIMKIRGTGDSFQAGFK